MTPACSSTTLIFTGAGRGSPFSYWAGFGFWQFAYASKQPLNAASYAAARAANYAAARAAMMSFKADGGFPLGIRPDTLIVAPSQEAVALEIVNTEYGTGGISNPWKGTAELIVTPYL